MLQSGNYISLVKDYLKIRITCNRYDFSWRLQWWNLVNSPQKYQMYDSNKSNGFEIFPSVGFTFCLRKFSSWYQDGVGNAWRPNERTKINAQETVPMHYSTFHVHTAATGLMSVLRGDGEAAHLRQPTLLVHVAPSNPQWQVFLLHYIRLLYTEEMSLPKLIPIYRKGKILFYMSLQIEKRKKKHSPLARAFGNKNHSCSCA